jgi:BirA family biotin operon repressor/biotin-[acetyl-CoA-carboxylase] ligase
LLRKTVCDSRIDEDAISAALKPARFGKTVYAFETIDSTNAFARTLAVRGHAEGTLVYAEHQTRGRGRWGRTWESAKGKGLIFSLVLRPAPGSAGVGSLTLAAATSVAQVLERRWGFKPKLRWPNDVTIGGKKVAGVLTETQLGTGGVSFAVMGVGVNVNQEEADFPPGLLDRAGSLRMASGRPLDRLDLLAELIHQIERDTLRLRSAGPDFALNRWIRRNAILGKTVTLRTRTGEATGKVRGFHADGQLVLVAPNGNERRFSDGEVIEVLHASGC